MKATIAQTDIALGKRDENLKKALAVIEKTGSDLVLFPELFTTGFDFGNLKELAEGVPGRTTDVLCRSCGDSIVGGSIIEEYGSGICNTFFLLDENGVLGTYRKMHLFQKEKEFFTPGKDAAVIDTRFGRIGLATCYDIRFPELFRTLVKEGAETVLVCAEFPSPRDVHWQVLLRARAIENQVFVIAANRVGHDGRQEYFGKSMAIDPWGQVLIEADGGEETLSFEIDTALVSKTRRDFPVLGDSKIL